MRAGNTYNALVFAPEYGTLVTGEIPLVLTREFIRVRRMAIPVNPLDLAEASVSAALNHMADSFDRQMDYASRRAVATYASNMGMATVRHNFNYIGIEQRWFHDGFAGYVSWAVMNHLLGAADNKVYWEEVSSLGKAKMINIPIEAFISYDTEVASLAQLRAAAQRLFLSVHSKFGREALERWFDSLDANKANIQSGNQSAFSILETVIGESIRSLN